MPEEIPKIPMSSGTLLNPHDPRDVTHNDLYLASAVPMTETILDTTVPRLPVMDQNPRGTCPNYDAVRLAEAYWYDQTGKIVRLSPRFLTIFSKQLDGVPEVQGTYPRVPMGTLCNVGCCTLESMPDDPNMPWDQYIDPRAITPAMLAEAAQYKIPGYITIPTPTLAVLRENLTLYRRLGITLPVGDFSTGHLLPPGASLPSQGLHRITLYGDRPDGSEHLSQVANQWGALWGQGGCGDFIFSKFAGQIFDVMAIAKLPQPVIDNAKKKSPNKAVLTRTSDDGRQTLGQIVVTMPDGTTWTRKTLELPWKGNERMKSCVPAGPYVCAMAWMEAMKANYYQLLSVPNRDGIFEHPGNFVTSTDGCIMIGDGLSDLNKDGLMDVTNTVKTIQELQDLMGGLTYDLVIVDAAKKPVFTRTLQMFSSGPDVAALQKMIGMPDSEIDGKFGGKTKAAVMQFQRMHGLLADGVVGRQTQAALLSI